MSRAQDHVVEPVIEPGSEAGAEAIDVPGLPQLSPQTQAWMAVPGTIYKYASVNKFSLGIITLGDLYFSSAKSFNDPFDTAGHVSFDAGAVTRKMEMRGMVERNMPELSRKEVRRLADKRLRAIKAGGKEREEIVRGLLQQQRYEKFGICCTTPKRNNLLMWAHYADHHKGICLGLDTDVLKRYVVAAAKQFRTYIEALPVTYQTDYPEVNFYEGSVTNPEDFESRWDITMRLVGTKSVHWGYEEEMRLVLWDGAGKRLRCGPGLVREVVLGCRVSDEDEQAVLRAVEAADSNAKVLRAGLHPHRFELEVAPV